MCSEVLMAPGKIKPRDNEPPCSYVIHPPFGRPFCVQPADRVLASVCWCPPVARAICGTTCRISKLRCVLATPLISRPRMGPQRCWLYWRTLNETMIALGQVAANQKGINLVQDLIKQYSLPVVQAYMGHIQASVKLQSMLLCALRSPLTCGAHAVSCGCMVCTVERGGRRA